MRAAGEDASRRLYVYNGGFLTQRRIRRILSLAGWSVRIGKPGAKDWVGVWGKSPTAHRGEAVANKSDARILRVEDAFLRSVLPGRSGSAPIGLLLDKTGVHFASATPSDLETLLAEHPLDDTALLERARSAMAWMRASQLSKYNAFDLDHPLPEAPYVLVIDQTEGDASITESGADVSRFKEMLYWARENHPGARIVIKSHPETVLGHRKGHFGPDDLAQNMVLCTDPVSPWQLFEGALAVYTVSSGLGFEAILAGHKPHVFGQPFYAGWGLTEDAFPVSRRTRNLTRAQLFAAAMILYPTWYDPCRDQLCDLEEAMAALEADARAWREDHQGYVASGMRLWKRRHLQQFFGRGKRLIFNDNPAENTDRAVMVWANKAQSLPPDRPVIRMEDGFIRSRGLGADLIPPVSLVTDDLGIYYDPTRESRLERLIAAAAQLPEHALSRAERVVSALNAGKLSKYNLVGQQLPDLPRGRRILVPGQVEDDASILKGCGEVRTNAALLAATRHSNPDAIILYKPHPDVEAGLRDGAIDHAAMEIANMVLSHADPIQLIDMVDEVWTMTSLLGFEALLRDTRVTCLGTPFYAGWGLTHDLGKVPARRQARPSVTALAHAALITYPRYFDPVSGLPCSVEVAIERLEKDELPRPGPFNRTVAKLQGVLASYAWIWR